MTFPVVLASASPRRNELLKRIYKEFEVLPADADETLVDGEAVEGTVLRLAILKARSVFQKRPDALVIGSDTLVALDRRILGKPADPKDAEEMLQLLSGETHQVLTAVACIWPNGKFDFVEVAQVTFRELDVDEIREYVGTGEPLDKAGSYAIQGGAKGFITKLEGDIDTVIGLPVEKLKQQLKSRSLT